MFLNEGHDFFLHNLHINDISTLWRGASVDHLTLCASKSPFDSSFEDSQLANENEDSCWKYRCFQCC